MEKVINRVFLAVLKAAGFCLLWLLIGPCPSSHTSVCSVCGMQAGISEVRLGATPIRLGQHFDFKTNAVSQAVLQDRSLANHAHDWLFASGGPLWVNGIGPGRHLIVPLRDTNAAKFVSQLINVGVKTNVEVWRRRLLDPKQTDTARSAIMVGREDRNEGESWADAAARAFADISSRPTFR